MKIQKNIIVEGNERLQKAQNFYENDDAIPCKKSKKNIGVKSHCLLKKE